MPEFAPVISAVGMLVSGCWILLREYFEILFKKKIHRLMDLRGPATLLYGHEDYDVNDVCLTKQRFAMILY